MIVRLATVITTVFITTLAWTPAALATAKALVSVDSEAAAIHVRDQVELEMEREITIGDVAEFSGFREDEIAEMKSVRIGEAPAHGESRVFTSSGLSQVFRTHLSRLQEARDTRIQLVIPARVVVKRKTFRLEARTVEDEIKRQMKAVCEECDIQIDSLNLPLLGEAFARDMSWHLKMRPELPKGSFSAPIEISGPGGRRQFWVSGRVNVFKTVPVAKRTIELGERIGSGDIAFERRDVTYRTDSFPRESEIVGAIASRAIAAESFVGRAMLRREQALKAGDTVKVTTGNETWRVSVEGLAQSGGFIGDVVRVRIPRTQKTISGVLLEKGLVEVR